MPSPSPRSTWWLWARLPVRPAAEAATAATPSRCPPRNRAALRPPGAVRVRLRSTCRDAAGWRRRRWLRRYWPGVTRWGRELPVMITGPSPPSRRAAADPNGPEQGRTIGSRSRGVCRCCGRAASTWPGRVDSRRICGTGMAPCGARRKQLSPPNAAYAGFHDPPRPVPEFQLSGKLSYETSAGVPNSDRLPRTATAALEAWRQRSVLRTDAHAPRRDSRVIAKRGCRNAASALGQGSMWQSQAPPQCLASSRRSGCCHPGLLPDRPRSPPPRSLRLGAA